MSPKIKSQKNPAATKTRNGMILIIVAVVVATLVWIFGVGASLTNFLGAFFVGVGGMSMVMVRLYEQNEVRDAEEAPADAPNDQLTWRELVSVLLQDGFPGRKDAREKRLAELDELAEEEKAKREEIEKRSKKFDNLQDFGIATLGFGGLLVAAAAAEPAWNELSDLWNALLSLF